MRIDKIIEVRSELGAGTRGSSLGIDAVKLAAIHGENDLFATRPSVVIKDENHLLYEDPKTLNARWIRGVYEVASRTCEKVSESLDEKTTPLVLTGDHGNAAGVIAGVKKAFPDKEIGIIWIDAHADLHTPYTSPSGNMHGMPLAAAMAEDNLDQKINDPAEETVDYWEKLKDLGGIQPKVKPENLFFLGLRSFEKQEEYLIDKHGIKFFNINEIREKGIKETCQNVIDSLSHCDHIYVSFDVDSLDPSISEGTGTPVPDGLVVNEAVEIINELVHSQKICVLEITEVNPLRDVKNKMAKTVIEILDQIIE